MTNALPAMPLTPGTQTGSPGRRAANGNGTKSSDFDAVLGRAAARTARPASPSLRSPDRPVGPKRAEPVERPDRRAATERPEPAERQTGRDRAERADDDRRPVSDRSEATDEKANDPSDSTAADDAETTEAEAEAEASDGDGEGEGETETTGEPTATDAVTVLIDPSLVEKAATVATDVDGEQTPVDEMITTLVADAGHDSETGDDAATTPAVTAAAADVDDDATAESGDSQTERVVKIEGEQPAAADLAHTDGDEQTSGNGDQTQSDAPVEQVDGDAPTVEAARPVASQTVRVDASAATLEAPGEERTLEVSATRATTTTAEVPEGEGEADPVWRQVRRAVSAMRTTADGDKQVTIKLRPAELGAVTVRVTTGDAGTAVSVVAETGAAASQLNQQRSLLMDGLEESGLGGATVDIGADGQHDAGDGTDGDNDGQKGQGGGTDTVELDSSIISDLRSRPRATSTMVDIAL